MLRRDEVGCQCIETVCSSGPPFTTRRRDCRLDRCAEDKRIASRLFDVTGDEDRPMFGDAHAHGGLYQHAVGEPILDQLLRLGEREPAQADAAGQRQQDTAAAVDYKRSRKLRLVVHDNGKAIARREPVIAWDDP